MTALDLLVENLRDGPVRLPVSLATRLAASQCTRELTEIFGERGFGVIEREDGTFKAGALGMYYPDRRNRRDPVLLEVAASSAETAICLLYLFTVATSRIEHIGAQNTGLVETLKGEIVYDASGGYHKHGFRFFNS